MSGTGTTAATEGDVKQGDRDVADEAVIAALKLQERFNGDPESAYRPTREFSAENSTRGQIFDRQARLLEAAGFVDGAAATASLADDRNFKKIQDAFVRDGNTLGLAALEDFKYLQSVKANLPAEPARTPIPRLDLG